MTRAPLTEQQLKDIQPPTKCICGRAKLCIISVQANGVRFMNAYCIIHAVHKIKAMRTFIEGRQAAGPLHENLDPGICLQCGMQAHVHLDDVTLCAECALETLDVDLAEPPPANVEIDTPDVYDTIKEIKDGIHHRTEHETGDCFSADEDEGPFVRG